MNGPSEMATESLDILWADAQITSLSVSYDSVELDVRESSGRRVRVVADGHIGFQLLGFWDEVVVESADLVPAHPFAEQCLTSIAERLGEPAPPTGSLERNSGKFRTLVVSLSDGALLLCAAARFHTELASG